MKVGFPDVNVHGSSRVPLQVLIITCRFMAFYLKRLPSVATQSCCSRLLFRRFGGRFPELLRPENCYLFPVHLHTYIYMPQAAHMPYCCTITISSSYANSVTSASCTDSPKSMRIGIPSLFMTTLRAATSPWRTRSACSSSSVPWRNWLGYGISNNL